MEFGYLKFKYTYTFWNYSKEEKIIFTNLILICKIINL